MMSKISYHRFYILVFVCFIFIFNLYSCKANDDSDLGLANKYYLEHNYDEALKIYEESLKKGYRSFDVFHNLGSIYYYERKDFKKAEEIFKQGILIYPNVDVLHSTLSQLYFDMDNLSEAVKEYKLAVKFGRDRPITINANKTTEILRHQGKNEKEVYDFFIQIINYNPKDYFALYEAAEYEKEEGKCKQAIDRYKRIIELSPNMKAVVLKDIGTCYYKLGDYKNSLSYFEEARKFNDFISEEFIKEIKNKIEENSVRTQQVM